MFGGKKDSGRRFDHVYYTNMTTLKWEKKAFRVSHCHFALNGMQMTAEKMKAAAASISSDPPQTDKQLLVELIGLSLFPQMNE